MLRIFLNQHACIAYNLITVLAQRGSKTQIDAEAVLHNAKTSQWAIPSETWSALGFGHLNLHLRFDESWQMPYLTIEDAVLNPFEDATRNPLSIFARITGDVYAGASLQDHWHGFQKPMVIGHKGCDKYVHGLLSRNAKEEVTLNLIAGPLVPAQDLITVYWHIRLGEFDKIDFKILDGYEHR